MDSIEKIEQFKLRTKRMSLRVINLYQNLPKTGEAQVIGKQLLRSATSVAANYRTVSRAKSEADKINKLKIVLEEADETCFWLELLLEANIFTEEKLRDLYNECEEIVKIVASTLSKFKQK